MQKLTPGDIVHARRRRWRVAEVRRYEQCELVTLAGADPATAGITRRVITPFETIEPVNRVHATEAGRLAPMAARVPRPRCRRRTAGRGSLRPKRTDRTAAASTRAGAGDCARPRHADSSRRRGRPRKNRAGSARGRGAAPARRRRSGADPHAGRSARTVGGGVAGARRLRRVRSRRHERPAETGDAATRRQRVADGADGDRINRLRETAGRFSRGRHLPLGRAHRGRSAQRRGGERAARRSRVARGANALRAGSLPQRRTTATGRRSLRSATSECSMATARSFFAALAPTYARALCAASTTCTCGAPARRSECTRFLPGSSAPHGASTATASRSPHRCCRSGRCRARTHSDGRSAEGSTCSTRA